MTDDDWEAAIESAVGLGTSMVQFIGGEPTLHPALPGLIDHALRSGLEVEIFSNLVHVSAPLWEVFAQSRVRLATSYYSDRADQHETITRRRGSYARTKANIAEAVRRSIPIRVGVIDVQDRQGVGQARTELTELGVDEVRVDRLRQVGRGVRDQHPNPAQLCGHCGHDMIVISADGWLDRHFGSRRELGEHDLCDPQCGPNCSPACNPSCWPTGAGPCGPEGGCQPNYD